MKNLTLEQIKSNYETNVAGIIGYQIGCNNVIIGALKRGADKDLIVSLMESSQEVAEKWWELRLEGPFNSDDINVRLTLEKFEQTEQK